MSQCMRQDACSKHMLRRSQLDKVVQVVGAPLAAGILQMDGIAGLQGWQWCAVPASSTLDLVLVAVVCTGVQAYSRQLCELAERLGWQAVVSILISFVISAALFCHLHAYDPNLLAAQIIMIIKQNMCVCRLFLLEGLPTVVLGCCLLPLLPRSPAVAPWLQAHEAETLQAALDAERAKHTTQSSGSTQLKDLLHTTFTHRGMYLLGCAKFCKGIMSYGLLFWAPVLIRSMLRAESAGVNSCDDWAHPAKGTDKTDSVYVLLTGIPYSLAIAVTVLFAWHSEVWCPSQHGHERLACCHTARILTTVHNEHINVTSSEPTCKR